MKKAISLVLILLVVISMCSCANRESMRTQAIELDWKSVHNQLISNEVKAKNEYDGKIVEWTGTVFRINDGFVDMANETSNGFPLNSIKVYLDNDEIANLHSGQTITVVGKLNLGSFSEIKNAFIVE